MTNSIYSHTATKTIKQTTRTDGFTIVEVIVAITVSIIFIAIFLQGFSFASAAMESHSRRANAMLVANSNVVKYRFKKDIINFDCRIHLDQKTGIILLNDSSTNKEPVPTGNYGGYFSQKVIAYTEYRDNPLSHSNNLENCEGLITVESSVEYGPKSNRTKVSTTRYAKEEYQAD